MRWFILAIFAIAVAALVLSFFFYLNPGWFYDTKAPGYTGINAYAIYTAAAGLILLVGQEIYLIW